jgi:hypothetical protein
MDIRDIRRLCLAFLLPASLTLVAWGSWPVREGDIKQTLTRQEMSLSTPSAEPGISSPAVPEERLLKLAWPATLRQGEESRFVLLTLGVAENGEVTPTLSAAGEGGVEEPLSIPNIYDTHNVMAEARLDIAGLAVAPDALVSVSLRPGETVEFRWNLRAAETGTYRGTVWLYLRYLPLDGGPESRDALKAIDIDIRVVNFLGIGGPAARMMGLLGVIACGLFGFSDLVSGIRWLRKRMKRKRQHAAH